MIGYRLKMLRIKKGLTQEELSDGIISISYISQIERDNKKLPKYVAEDLAKRLNVSVDYLLGDDLRNDVSYLKDQFSPIYQLIEKGQSAEALEQLNDLKKCYVEAMNHPEISPYLHTVYILIEYQKRDFLKVESLIQSSLEEDEPYKGYPLVILHRVRGVMEYLKHNIDSSVEYFKKAIEIASTEKYVDDLGRLYQNIGTCYAMQKDFYKANRSYYSALKVYRENIDLNGQIKAHINIANVLSDISEDEEAIEWYHKAIALLQYSLDESLESIIKYNLAHSYFQIGEKNRAKELAKEALEAKKSIGDDKGIIRCQLLLCDIYIESNQLKNLKQTLLNTSLSVENIEDPNLLSKYYRIFGKLLLIKGDLKGFEEYYLKSIEHYKKVDDYKIIGDMYFELAENISSEKYYKLSAEYYRKGAL